MSNGSKFLVWAYRYGAVGVQGEDTLEDAVSYAKAGEDMGEHSFSHVEEVGVGIVDSERVNEVWDRLREDEDAVRREESNPTHLIDIKSLTHGDWAFLRAVYDGQPDTTEDVARFGADRIRVRASKNAP